MTSTPKRKRIEIIDTHSRRLIKLAEAQLAKGNRNQASEKAWRAVAHQTKAIANKRGWQFDQYSHFFDVTAKIARETEDPEHTTTLFTAARILHQNYYIDATPLSQVKSDIGLAKELLRILNNPTLLKQKTCTS